MKRLPIAAVSLGIAFGPVADASAQRPAERPAQAVAVPAGVTARRDLAYGPDPAQRLDVYAPSGARGAPMLVMAHGGAWRIGDKRNARFVQGKLDHWSGRGFVVVSVNYRMIPAADPLEQARDLARALALVQGRAREFGGDADRVVLLGHSAGAHLAALLAADPALAAAEGARPWRGTVVLDSGVMDLPALMQDRHLPLYDEAFGADPAFWRAASPAHRLKGPVGPMLIVCSTLRADACPQGRAFAAAAGPKVELHAVALTHRQINEQLGEGGDYTARVTAFIDSALAR